MRAASPPFLSYSANHEDVILNRVFGRRDHGFYVDVGAAHPLFENDTKALYDRGWRGTNIEPNPSFFRELVAQRSGDCNINAAVSDAPGEITYHEVVGTGLSTCDPDEANRAAAKGFEVVRYSVTAVTLRSVLEKGAPAMFDLLKVDVEGFELKVLSSNDWTRFRPQVILAEATFPESPQRRDDGVETYLAGQGYRRVYFDGLNDFYVEYDFQPPAGAFDRPLNIFDHYESYQLQSLRHERENAETKAASLEQELARRVEELDHTGQEIRRARLAADASSLDLEQAREELACTEQKLHRAKLAAETSSLDLEHAREELTCAEQKLRRSKLAAEASSLDLGRAREELRAMRARCRGLIAQLGQISSQQTSLSQMDSQQDQTDSQETTPLDQTGSQETTLNQIDSQQILLEISEQLRQVYLSTSWRITRPMRALKRPRRTLRILLGQPADRYRGGQ
jgi:FkbM family methyltransferase